MSSAPAWTPKTSAPCSSDPSRERADVVRANRAQNEYQSQRWPSCDPGDTYQSPFGVGEMTDDKAVRRCGRTHDTGTSELFGALQGSLDIRDADVKDSVALVTRSASDATADACPVFGGDQVQEPVATRFRYLSCYRRGYVEFPAEELAEVLAEPSRIFTDDLKMHDRL